MSETARYYFNRGSGGRLFELAVSLAGLLTSKVPSIETGHCRASIGVKLVEVETGSSGYAAWSVTVYPFFLEGCFCLGVRMGESRGSKRRIGLDDVF